MIADLGQPASGRSGTTTGQGRSLRQIAILTAGAICLYSLFRYLPTGTNLSHMDFRAGAGSIEFCDPGNPQFLPVVAVRSPVEMVLRTETPAREGRACEVVCALKTTTGKAISAGDLAVTHTRKLHLMIIDPSLQDYQHVHPEPIDEKGHWRFQFTPKFSGLYRIFGDFTPIATGRGLYASADLEVEADGHGNFEAREPSLKESDRYQFGLKIDGGKPVAGKAFDLVFEASAAHGSSVPLEQVMGSYAHLVAFDVARKGFAHLHPKESDPSWRPDRVKPKMTFRLTVPEAGSYLVWAQVNLEGTIETRAFPLQVSK